MRLEAAKYLFDVQSAAATLAGFVEGRDWEAYRRDAMLRAAVERQFEIIGEVLAQLGRRAPDVLASHEKVSEVFPGSPGAGGSGLIAATRPLYRYAPQTFPFRV